MIHFAFVWRLEQEKWFDRILRAYEIFCSRYPMLQDLLHISVFWEGTLFNWKNISNIESTISLPWLYYYGKIDRSIIDSVFKDHVHYSLVPSLFLETFWLVALESLQNGVPVIGYKKGGLIPFIDHENALDENLWAEWIVVKLYQIIQNNSLPNKNEIIHMYEQYSIDIWRRNLISLVGNSKRILIINDYKSLIGWAEMYVSFLQKNLEMNGCIVDVLGYNSPSIPSWKRKLLFLQALCNVRSFFAIREYILNNSPEIIWCHSILRYHGVFWLLAIQLYWKNIKKMITYHDFWLISPFPSKIESINQIPMIRSIPSWMTSSRKFLSPKLLFGLLVKYVYTFIPLILIRTFDSHIVPSQFMVWIIARNIEKEEKDITLFPHCAIR